MYLERKQQMAIIVVAAIILFAAGYRIAVWKSGQVSGPSGVPVEEANVGSGAREITVHVSGSVQNPGVYKFPGEARVKDAVEKASPLAAADVQGLNLARPLKDGERIDIPSKPESSPVVGGKSATPGNAGRPAVPGRVNINRAGMAELETLPGLGPALAERIINYRKNKGLFSTEEELKNVTGIGEKKYQKIKDKITVN